LEFISCFPPIERLLERAIHTRRWEKAFCQKQQEGKLLPSPIGGMQALASAQVLIISEGYATAATLAEATGLPTVSAFDSGGLLPVAQTLQQKYPDKSIIIAGDDDLNVGKTLGINPGRVKATEAAQAVGGIGLFPIFAPGEQSPESKDFTDFHDLAHSSLLGTDGVKRQMQPIIEKTVREMELRESETQRLEVIAKKE
jgi:putative DNA primase/helicase